MIWAYFAKNEPYTMLVRDIVRAVKPFVSRRESEEEKDAIPHATLCRFGDPIDVSTIIPPQFFPTEKSFKINSLLLLESDLSGERPRYAVIAEFPFSG
jgi:2'-5' RNA ligase